MGLLYIAKKYCVDLLTKLCSEFLIDNISPENACQIMEAAYRMSDSEIYEKCLSIIKKDYETCLKSESFTSLSKECVESLTALDDVFIKKEVLYEHVIRWAESECQRKKLDVSWESKREVLGDIIYNIRFPLMDSKYFATKVAVTELLTSDEKIDILLYQTSEKELSSTHFKFVERTAKYPFAKVVRFPSEGWAGWGHDGRMDAISFKPSDNSNLYGIFVYGCQDGNCKYSVDIVVKNSVGLSLKHVSTEIYTGSVQKNIRH